MLRFPSVSATLTRPGDTTQYGANELIANSTTPGSVAALRFPLGHLSINCGVIRRATLYKNDATTTAASFRLHLFKADPTGSFAAGDNDAFAVPSVAAMIATIDIDMSSGAFAGTAGLIDFAAVSPEVGFDLRNLDVGQWAIYGLMEAVGAYQPAASEQFTWTLDLEV